MQEVTPCTGVAGAEVSGSDPEDAILRWGGKECRSDLFVLCIFVSSSLDLSLQEARSRTHRTGDEGATKGDDEFGIRSCYPDQTPPVFVVARSTPWIVGGGACIPSKLCQCAEGFMRSRRLSAFLRARKLGPRGRTRVLESRV